MMRSVTDVAGTGFTVLDRVYADGGDAFEALGGSCGNVLVSLALLDRRVTPVIALGCDPIGDALWVEFEQAGADTSFIFRSNLIESPVLIQLVDTFEAQHEFSFVCPDTLQDFPRFTPIEDREVGNASFVLSNCSIFFADRVSEAILSAMEIAAQGGAMVFFEPSAIDDADLFRNALRHTTILKYSLERFPELVDERSFGFEGISIATFGREGLQVRAGGRSVHCPAAPADQVRDTSGSGDMVTVGIIDHLLALGRGVLASNFEALIPGVAAGQRLAAANCAYTGARGLFRQRGPETARAILDGCWPTFDSEMEPSFL